MKNLRQKISTATQIITATHSYHVTHRISNLTKQGKSSPGALQIFNKVDAIKSYDMMKSTIKWEGSLKMYGLSGYMDHSEPEWAE